MTTKPLAVLPRCLWAALLVGLVAGLVGGLALALLRGGVVHGPARSLVFVANMAAIYALGAALVALIPAALATLAGLLPPLRRRVGTWGTVAPVVIGALVAGAVASKWAKAFECPVDDDIVALLAAVVTAAALSFRRGWVEVWPRALPLALVAALAILGGVQLLWVPETGSGAPPGSSQEAGAFAEATGGPEGEPVPLAGPPPRNVLFIVIDTLRADHLSCYGYARQTSPVMDGLAENGALFERAIVQRPKTSPSMASILSGTYPHTHGVAAVRSWLPEEVLTLPEVLSAAGWRTAGFVSNPNLYHDFNFQQGFDAHGEIGTWDGGNGAAEVNAEVLPWLEANHEKPFFLYVHYIDPHSPYDPPPPYRDRFLGDELDGRLAHVQVPVGGGNVRELNEKILIENGSTDLDLYVRRYDEETLYVDAEIGRLVGVLGELGVEDETLIVITSDHGESMTEHEVYFNHGLMPFENNIRVPLIFVYPPAIERGRRIADLVESIDLMPTILDILGLSGGLDLEGESLLPLLLDRGGKRRTSAFAESGYSDPAAFLTSVSKGPWKLVSNPKGIDLEVDPYRPSVLVNTKRLRRLWWAAHGGPAINERWVLYNVEEDPEELVNVAGRYPEVYAALRAELEAWLALWPEKRESRTVPPEELSPELERSLRGLGYLP